MGTLVVFAIAAFVYLILCLGLFLAQRSFIYYPQPKSTTSGNASLTLNVDGATVLVSTLPRQGQGAIIYFGAYMPITLAFWSSGLALCVQGDRTDTTDRSTI
jgi:hypothetical protein